METVIFKGKNKDEDNFVVALRKNVNDYFKHNHLSTKANFAMIFKTIIMLSFYIIPYLLIVFTPLNSFLALFLVILMGIGVAGVGMCVMHDACHGAYSSNFKINNLLSASLYLLGSDVLNWKIQHNYLHHTYTNVPGYDEDIDSKGPIRLSKKSPWKWYHRFQFLYAFIFYGMMTITKLIDDFPNLISYHKNGYIKYQKVKVNRQLLKMAIRKLIYLFIIIGIPIIVATYSVIQIVTAFLLMHWVASIILSYVFQMAHVVEGARQPLNNEIDTNWFIHQLNTTSDFARNNKILSWYVGGLNFQIEHHLFPSICHIHYKKIAPIVEKTVREFGFTYNLKTSFSSALSSHMQSLIILGKK